MDLGFSGEVVGFYHRYRRGYPARVVDAVVEAFELTADALVADLGCGTGQLTLPLAERVEAAVALDPEPEMLGTARRAATERDIRNVLWLHGSDDDVPALATLLGGRRFDAVTIAQALHWMDYERLFPALASLIRPGGGLAVISNGVPLWLQETDWSRSLRRFMEQWLGTTLNRTCGTDRSSRERCRVAMEAAGFTTEVVRIGYSATLDLEQIVGGVYSALPVDKLPPAEDRPAFAQQLRRALPARSHFSEQVRVTMLLGHNDTDGGSEPGSRRSV